MTNFCITTTDITKDMTPISKNDKLRKNINNNFKDKPSQSKQLFQTK